MCSKEWKWGNRKRKGKEILFTVLLKHLYRHKEFFCSVKHSKYTAVLQNNFSFNILRINRKKQKQPSQTHTKNLKSFLENIRVQHDLSYFNFLSCTTILKKENLFTSCLKLEHSNYQDKKRELIISELA